MKKIMISPSKYIQGECELVNLGSYINELGKRALLVASVADQRRVEDSLSKALKNNPFEVVYGEFNEECTKKEIDRMLEIASDKDCDVFVGLGGGKALDTAKAASFLSKKPVIIVPTIASTDAPTSKLAIIYTENGEFQEYFHLNKNPDLVLVDTDIIAKAPTRFLIAGMGDALSTYFEARACIKANNDNMPGGKSTKAAFAIAACCYETLLEDSEKAAAACKNNVVTKALENIIEANILLSGLGFESSGLAAAHSIHNGLTVLEEAHKFFHGEKVAFGTIVHLVLENAPARELNTVIEYCRTMGLPTCLKDLGVLDVTEDKIMAVAEAACAEGETIHNMPFDISVSEVYAAIMAADEMGCRAI